MLFPKKKKNVNDEKPSVADNQNEVVNKKSVPSIIVSDLNIEGDLVSYGAVEVGGKVKGNVRCNNVVIRKEAHITGDVKADNVTVLGKVKGKIFARNVFIKSSGVVSGNIEYDSLNVEGGANIDCNCKKVSFAKIGNIVDMKEDSKPVKKKA